MQLEEKCTLRRMQIPTAWINIGNGRDSSSWVRRQFENTQKIPLTPIMRWN